MPRCTFCGIEVPKGTGKMFVFVTGKIDHFCGSKCEKNSHKLKRKPANVKWTETYRREHKKGQRKERVSREEKKAAEKKSEEEMPAE